MGLVLKQAVLLVGLIVSVFSATSAAAQSTWVQVEALPTLAQGQERARAYSGVFANVSGFRMSTGWFAVALGPFTTEDAASQLSLLKGERMIPADSYLAVSGDYGQRFWPNGESLPSPATVSPKPVTEAPETQTGLAVDTESPSEARRSEALLSTQERMLLQEALQWEGHYASAIDGAIGPGTRSSMAAWQAARGYEPSGTLTTFQRNELVTDYQAERAALGLQTVSEFEAGIEITLPLALVGFDRYAPPFVHFKETDGSGMRVILISQTGDQGRLFGLYDIMQTLEIVPLQGERTLGRTSFEINGANDRLASYTYATLTGGLIKGFTLVWEPQQADRAAKVLSAMKSSFKPTGDKALSDGLGVPLAVDRADLLAGLEIRRPVMSRSGFYIDPMGTVATTNEVLAGCGRITIDDSHETDVVLEDAANGLAVLKPRETLAPPAYANLRRGPARINGEVAVAGFSYEDALSAAVLSFGTLADLKGLNGESNLLRLAVRTLPGDAGGPVLDASGKVVGILMPRHASDGRVLPEDVSFALDADSLALALEAGGLAMAQPISATDGASDGGGMLAAEDLTLIGRDMTVLVSCWQ